LAGPPIPMLSAGVSGGRWCVAKRGAPRQHEGHAAGQRDDGPVARLFEDSETQPGIVASERRDVADVDSHGASNDFGLGLVRSGHG
jgi:hypothetical protein